MLSVEWIGKEELVAKFGKMNDSVHLKLLQFITGFSLKLQTHVVSDKLQGQVLNHITGKLAASIHSAVDDQGQKIVGRVYSASINYAAIHEFGGVIKHPGGTAWMMIGPNPVFVSNATAAKIESISDYEGGLKRTAAHNIPMPERSYLRSSLADMGEEFTEGTKQAVGEAIHA
jgi:phage gpG-like protein